MTAIVPIVPDRRPGGQLPDQDGPHRFSRILAPVYRSILMATALPPLGKRRKGKGRAERRVESGRAKA